MSVSQHENIEKCIIYKRYSEEMLTEVQEIRPYLSDETENILSKIFPIWA